MSQAGALNSSGGSTGNVQTLTGNSGGPVSPTANNINTVGTGSITVVGNPGTSTLTTQLTGLTNHNVLVGAGTATITNVAPSTAGFVLTSNGASADPSFQAAAASGITTINGDTGSVTGSTVSIISNVAATGAGATVKFSGSGTTLTYTNTDGSNNTLIGNAAGNSSSSLSANVYLGANAGGGASNISNSVFVGVSAGAGSGSLDNSVFVGTSSGSSAAGSTACVFVGRNAGASSGSANNSTCVGDSAGNNASLSETICIGANAGGGTNSARAILIGRSVGAGANSNDCIYMGYNLGISASETNTIRIGVQGSGSGQQNITYIAGIFGTTTSDVGSTTAVLIDNTGNLGTVASSKRFKKDIQDMGEASSALLNLRPVTFQYKSQKSDHLQYGLIAEEVNEVMPGIVNLDEEGAPLTVRYHDLPALLLNELIKMKKEIQELKTQLSRGKCDN